MSEVEESPVAYAIGSIKEIGSAFADEIGRKPSLSELLQILMWGLKSQKEPLFVDVHPRDILDLRAAGLSADVPDISSIAELNDHVFVLASDFVPQLADRIAKVAGKRPTLQEFCYPLQEALSKNEAGLSETVSKKFRIKAELSKKKSIVAKVGDVMAIPAKNGEYFTAVYLAKNRFGLAFGFFTGTSVLRAVSLKSHGTADPYPVYSGDDFIANGRWKIIGHDETLRSLFPEEPEIYHEQYKDHPRPNIGPYGSGETSSGRLRELSKKEAEEIGLLDGSYRSVYQPNLLEDHLNRCLR